MASAETAALLNNQREIVRQLADFPENIWANRIASFTLDNQGYEMYAKEIEMLKEEVMSMLLETEKPMMEKFDLIDKIERLGISHHFENKIEHQLQELYDAYPNFQEHPECDLLTAALQFRLFRQHGFNISCGIFDQFIDDNGKFKESLCKDIWGLLSLYEAAHVRTNGDKILEEALAFTTTHLTLGVPHLGSTPAKRVKHALEQPLHKGIPRYEAHCYISMYEKDESNNKLLLRLAKLDYHLLQMLYKQELSEIIRWGKDLDIVTKVPYARDRIVECYFWAVGTYYEPQYSLARMALAKAIVFAGMIDDTYDAYGTLDELKIFTESIERWDGNGIDQLSDYLKAAYTMLLNFNKELEEYLAKKRRTFAFDKYIEEVWYHVANLLNSFNSMGCAKIHLGLNLNSSQVSPLLIHEEKWKQYMRTSFTQSKWFLTNKLPSFADYLSNGMITSTYYSLPSAAFLGVDGASEDVIKWMSTNPKLFVALTTHARLTNDVGSHKFEKERGSGTAIECYMKDYNVSEEEAMRKFEEMYEDTWKIMNEECLRPTTIPREILKVILNLARTCEVVYKQRGDGFTDQRRIEAHIKAMIMDSISVCG